MDDEKSLWFQPDQLKKGVCNKFNTDETWSIRMGTSVGGKGEVKYEGEPSMFVHKMQHQKKSIRLKTAQKLFDHIETDFKHM
mmetsp:Transcript_98366/g.212087  ORF Transcript_98366/g.212087 Transcript_98366/m.212087 type:complete len:82 (+) Transcript_98366:928-1173(+)